MPYISTKHSVKIAIILMTLVFASCKKQVNMDFTTSPLSISDSILLFGTNTDTIFTDSMQIRDTSDPTYSYDNTPAISQLSSSKDDSVQYISPNLKHTSPEVVIDAFEPSKSVTEQPQTKLSAKLQSPNKPVSNPDNNARLTEVKTSRDNNFGTELKPINIPEDIATCKTLLSQQEKLFHNEKNAERKEQIRKNIISLTDKIRYEAKWKGDDNTYEEARKIYETYK